MAGAGAVLPDRAEPVAGEGGVRRVNARSLVVARRIYAAIAYLQDRATADRIAAYANLPRSVLYYHLGRLVARGFLGKERVGGRVVYRILRPLNAVELSGEVDRLPGEGDAYRVARMVRKLMEVYGIEGDLIGSAKIHIETYPWHIAVFPIVDVVVVREHAEVLANLVVNYLNGTAIYSEKLGAVVVRLPSIPGGVAVHVHIDGVREGGRLLWKLRDHIRRYGGLTLEHAVVASLVRPQWTKNDRDDVYVALARVDMRRFLDLLKDAVEPKPRLVRRVRERLIEVLRFAKEYFPDVEEAVETVVKKVLDSLDELEPALKGGPLSVGVGK